MTTTMTTTMTNPITATRKTLPLLLMLTLVLALVLPTSLRAQTKLETEDLTSLYSYLTATPISIHDPSVVYRDGKFYIWGSHLGAATSSDLVSFSSVSVGTNTFRKLASQGATSGTACTYEEAFNTQQVTKVKNAKGETVDMPNFDAEAYCSRYADDKDTWVSGVMWAPDIIYNPTLGKWCLYLSLNGDNWSSIIILLTSSSATGPFTYQAPIVMSGFYGITANGIQAPTYADTDMAIALGETLTETPSRYTSVSSDPGKYWPNCIDPCVFFDEQGELWMTYGSWSGGIFMLKLDKETGLRDYTNTYESDFDSKGASFTSDPYFGTKIAGGYYVSGEGSYVQHIGDYYYLFVSYGGYDPNGGYDMRVFRSTDPQGPYTDASGNSALFTSWANNYTGTSSTAKRGMRLVGAYNDWGGIQDVGERAQGHNSACADEEGRTFLVYHTKFNDGTAGHQVRVHQLFLNEDKWPLCSPFIYQGETDTDSAIASSQPYTMDELTGDYELLQHPFNLDYTNYEEMLPSLITLTADGKVSGDVTGTWGITEGTGYMWMTLSGTTYKGVWCRQSINGATTNNLQETNLKALAFTSLASNGVPLWGYKLEPQSAIAWNYGNNTLNLKDNQSISSNVSIWFDTDNNTTLSWTSSCPEVLNETGKYAPADTTTQVTMTARLSSGDYYWEQDFNVKAAKATTISGDYLSGMLAYYDFDETPTYNHYKPATETDYDRITYGAFSTSGTAPTLSTDYDRFGSIVHVYNAKTAYNSYARMPNPLLGADPDELTGFTIAFWVKRNDDDLWGPLWGFSNFSYANGKGPRLYLTGNTYVHYDDNGTTSYDFNSPDAATYTNIPVGQWTHVTLTMGTSNNLRFYINGKLTNVSTITDGDGTTIKASQLPTSDMVSTVSELKYLYLGACPPVGSANGGSPDIYVDDLMVYSRELSLTDAQALYKMANRVTDFTVGENGTDVKAIEAISPTGHHGKANGSRYSGTYDLTGRRISNPQKGGVYIIDGVKVVK